MGVEDEVLQDRITGSQLSAPGDHPSGRGEVLFHCFPCVVFHLIELDECSQLGGDPPGRPPRSSVILEAGPLLLPGGVDLVPDRHEGTLSDQ